MASADLETQGMMPWIRAAARAIRVEADRSPARIAADRDVRESTVTRFESGKTVQIDVDRLIAAYSLSCGTPPIEFWRRALELWEMSLRV